MAQSSIIDMEDICRVCGERFYEDEDEWLDIYESHPLDSSSTYSQLLMMYGLDEPKKDDGLSRKIGAACALELIKISKWKENIQDHSAKLLEARRGNPNTDMEKITEMVKNKVKLAVTDENQQEPSKEIQR